MMPPIIEALFDTIDKIMSKPGPLVVPPFEPRPFIRAKFVFRARNGDEPVY
ncbi:hypothetical protein SHLA_4c000850 [Shinella sp. DD12]|nr:hypothetical protein SHLA_4c000850 [Shinella sp. DD12]